MSETSQGPGWWQASDGKWYPPHLHPAAQQPAPPTAAQPEYGAPPTQYAAPAQAAYGAPARAPYGAPAEAPYGAPAQPQPLPPPTSGSRGCLVAALGVVVVLVALAIGGVIAFRALAHRVSDKVESLTPSTTCDFLTDAEATQVLGGNVVVVQVGGLAKIAGPALDGRVLPDAPTCWATNVSRVARVARQSGGNAESTFQAEEKRARGTAQDEGNGTTRSTDPYYAGPVSGLGDEAFCTDLDEETGAAGVLVRDGDVLVYASLTPDLSTVSAGESPINENAAREACQLSQQLARAALN